MKEDFCNEEKNGKCFTGSSNGDYCTGWIWNCLLYTSQFIEDSVIAIRHNTVLDDFFQKEEYDLEEIEPQLSYSMELFSERNMVERQLPFATGIYLFNNGNDCIYEHYYACLLYTSRCV